MHQVKQICFLSLAVLLTLDAHSQSLFEEAVSAPESTNTPASGDSTLTYTLGGNISAASIWSWEQKNFMYNYAGLGLNASVDKQDFGRAYADARVSMKNDTPEFRLREAWTALYMGPVELTLGEQIVAWGRADGINPTNNFSTMDANRLDFDLDEARIGNLMARMRLNFTPLLLEILAVPAYRYPILVSSLDIDSREEYNTVLFGARMNIITSPIEGSVSYYNGRVPESGVRITAPENSENPVPVQTRVAAKQQVLGLDFATVLFGLLGLRGEGAWSWYAEENSDLPEVPRPELEWVVGLDRTFFSNLSVIAQYYGKYVMDWQENDSPLTVQAESTNRILFGQTHQWQHGISLNIKASLFNEIFHIEAMSNINFITEDLQTGLKLTYNITDAFDISGGFTLVNGPDASRMDLLKDTYRNIFFGMSVEF